MKKAFYTTPVTMQDDIFNGEFRSNQNIWDF